MADTTSASEPSPELKRLEIFVGRWRTEGRILESPSGPPSRLVAVDTYEWLPGGYFLVHRVEGRMGDVEVQAIEILGFDPSSGTYRTHSFDNQGNAATYEASLQRGVWKIWGKSERFTGEFAEDGSTLAGRWERSSDGSSWEPWMEITLTRMS